MIELRSACPFAVSVIVVSFNTRDLLRECLTSLLEECGRLPSGAAAEVLVIDNASSDGSAEMVAREFADSVRLLRSDVNLGFGVANNVAIEAAQGRHLVLLNSDAFFQPGALARALEHLDSDPGAGIGGARLVGRDGTLQPSARAFHSIAGTALVLSGLSDRIPLDATRMDRGTAAPAAADWVTGAFMIVRREALARAGLFDPAFFLYFEEVDLCRRIRAAGFRVMYWPDVVVTHLGGESSRTLGEQVFSDGEAQVVLWRMRSTLLYFRKHHGWQVWLARWLEQSLLALRVVRNRVSRAPARRARGREAALLMRLMRQAWHETEGGRVSPPRPW